MRFFIGLCHALVALVPLEVVALTDAQNTTKNADLFLTSCNINPSKVDYTAKRAGSTVLACAIFEALWSGETVAVANSSVYTSEREAHW